MKLQNKELQHKYGKKDAPKSPCSQDEAHWPNADIGGKELT